MDSQSYWKNKLEASYLVKNINKLPLYGFQFFFKNTGKFKTPFYLLTFINILSASSRFGSIYLISLLLSNITTIKSDQIFSFYLPIFLLLKIATEILDFFTRKFFEAFPTLYTDHLLLRFYKTILNSDFTKIIPYSKERLNGLIHLYTSNVSGFLSDWVWGLPRQITTLIIIIAVLFFQNPIILLVNALYFTLFLIISFKKANQISTLAKKLADHNALSNSVNQSFYFNLNSVKRLNITQFFETNYKKYTKLKWDKIKTIRSFHAHRWLVQLNLFNLIFISTLFYGIYQVSTNKLSLGFLILINWAYNNLWSIMVYIIEYYAQLVQQKANTNSIRDEFSIIVKSNNQKKPFPKEWNIINFNNVYTSFINRNQKHLKIKIPSLSISKGEHIGIIGKSGSGKSTVLNILLGIIEFQGRLTINHRNFKNVKISRSDICLINNDDPLFNISIWDNITLGKKTNKQKTEKILNGLQVSSFVKNFDTRIGDVDSHFSSGQLQRLRLARGILQNAKFYLLDEPFNGIDKENKTKIIHFIKNHLKNKTVILVTHNPSELKLIDQVYTFKKHQLSKYPKQN